MTAHIAVELIGDPHHKGQRQQLDADTGKHIGHGPDGKQHAVHQNRHNNHHKQEAGAAAGVMLGLDAGVFHGQRKPRLIAENGFVLRAVVGEQAADILHPGNSDQVTEENHHPKNPIHQIPSQNAFCNMLHQAGNQGRNQHEQQQREAYCQHHREANDELFHFFVSELAIQPLLKPGGLLRCLLRIEVRRVHQCLYPADHAVQKRDAAADQRPSQDRISVPDELQILLLDHQSVGTADNDSLLFRPPHQNPLNQGLSADTGAKAGGFVFFHIALVPFQGQYTILKKFLQHMFYISTLSPYSLSFLSHGERNCNDCTAAGGIGNLKGAIVQMNNLVAHGQANTRATGF